MIDNVNVDAKNLVTQLNRSDPDNIYILGRNKFTNCAAQFINFCGFIDDFTNETEYLGKRIVRINELNSESYVINGSTMSPLKASRNISSFTTKQIHVFDFLENFSEESKALNYWVDFRDDFLNHTEEYAKFENSLSDEISIETWNHIKYCRLTGSFLDLEIFPKVSGTHYLPEFLNFKKIDHVFYDIGSFDGETALDFIESFTDFDSIFAFEPNPANQEVLQNKIGSIEGVVILDTGVSNINEFIGFSNNLGSASHFDAKSDLRIQVNTLDSLMIKPPTFIKMDIEGMERKALDGGRNLISKHRPILAISVYHLFDDIRIIFSEINEILPNSKFYLRHFSEGIDETVLFCIPN